MVKPGVSRRIREVYRPETPPTSEIGTVNRWQFAAEVGAEDTPQLCPAMVEI